MKTKENTKHVPDFSLKPVSGTKQISDRINVK